MIEIMEKVTFSFFRIYKSVCSVGAGDPLSESWAWTRGVYTVPQGFSLLCISWPWKTQSWPDVMFTVDWARALPSGLHVDMIDNLNNSEKLFLSNRVWKSSHGSCPLSIPECGMMKRVKKTHKQSLKLRIKNDLRLLWRVTNVIGSIRMT